MEPCVSSHNLLAKGIIKGKTVSLLERKLGGSELTLHTSQRQEVLFANRRRKKGGEEVIVEKVGGGPRALKRQQVLENTHLTNLPHIIKRG